MSKNKNIFSINSIDTNHKFYFDRIKRQFKTIRLIEVTHSLFYTPQYVAITQGFLRKD